MLSVPLKYGIPVELGAKAVNLSPVISSIHAYLTVNGKSFSGRKEECILRSTILQYCTSSKRISSKTYSSS